MQAPRSLEHHRRLSRFIVTGLGSTLLHAAVALTLIDALGSTPPAANGIAFCVATVFSYFVNTLWSFSAYLHGKNLRRFLVVSVIGFFLAMGLAWVAELLGWSPIAGVGLVVVVVPGLSFLMHNGWTYR